MGEKGKKAYVFYGVVYYFLTILCTSLAIMVLVQGFLSQAEYDVVFAFFYYVATVFLLVVSYFFFRDGHKKLAIAESSP